MRNFFEGCYYKHQKGEQTLCLIAGRTREEKFIQVITRDFSSQIPFSEGNCFSKKGVILDIHTEELNLTGKIRYEHLSPIRYDIMGPFRFFPMECRHGIVSMRHELKGAVTLNGEKMDFTGGVGYIEKDSGTSFPKSYLWVQAVDEYRPYTVMVSVADIPFGGIHFRGCICVIQCGGREYRLATYLGVRVLVCTKDRLLLKQRSYTLEVKIREGSGFSLRAPQQGQMKRTIRETAACPAEFIFKKGEKIIFHLYAPNASFEYEE